MGNLPSSTSTEPLAPGKHRNLSTISLPPTIPRRHNMKDSERKEIFPISDEGAPPLPGRRGSIGFFRGKRARAPMTLDHNQLFQNLQNLQNIQNLDLTHCSWQNYHYLSDSSNPNSNLNSLSTTPTTAATTPALTAAATPTTPVGPQYYSLQYQQSRSPQPASPVAVSIQDYHPKQEQKLATFMKRNLLPPHTLLTPTSLWSLSSVPNSASSSPTVDCCSNTCLQIIPEQQQPQQQPPPPQQQTYDDQRLPQSYHQSHFNHQSSHSSACDHRPAMEHHSSLDYIPSTHDVPTLSVSDWGNQGRWAGEQDWSEELPEGLEHDGGPWDTMDSYTVEQHITRALCKGQNYSAPLDFSKQASHLQGQTYNDFEPNDTETATCNRDLVSSDMLDTHPVRPSSSVSSMATLDPQTAASVLDKGNERSLVILSVGCGNTQWATEMALAHPHSAIHAINVSQISTLPAVPETTPSFDLDNLFFYNLDDNSLRVPFVSNSVDYIHVRRFLPNVSKAKYLAFLRELVRVLKVDGYLELVELDLRLRDSGVDSCWPSYWTLIGFDKMGIDASLALNLAGIMRTMPGMEVSHKSCVHMPVGIHGGRIGLTAELLCWRFALTVRPWLMRQAMLSGAEFDDLLERARQETRTLKSYQAFHIAVGRKTAAGGVRASACANAIGLVQDESASSFDP